MEEKAKEIFIRYIDGDEQAFAELVCLLSRRFFRMFFHLGADTITAEDLCQEFFLSLHRGGATFRKDCKFMPWAYSIARNIYYREVKRISKIKIIPIHQGMADQYSQVSCEKYGIAGILAKLSEEKRIVFELKHYQELKFSEIAELLNVPEGTVKSRMFKAIREIREILSRRMK